MMDPSLIPWVILGTIVGISVGAVPGLTGAMAISLALPLTYALQAESALALLVAMYVGSVSGGLITATLLNMPGTPASIVTTLDGYPMASSGRPTRALTLGVGASLVGGLLSWVVLVLLSRPLAEVAIRLHPFDLFALVVLALVFVSALSRGDLVRGLFSAALGMLVAMPGLNPSTGQARWTFGFPEMADGFRLLPVLLGLFAVSQALQQARFSELRRRPTPISLKGGQLPTFKDWRRQWLNLLSSSGIGSFVGVLPGIGANIGSLLAYGAARSWSPRSEEFGKGCDDGVVASEAANNATVGGALVPLISLGIPGSVIDAILLGAFVLHGLQPGPLLFQNHPEIGGAIISSYLVANLVMVLVMAVGARWCARLALIPNHVLVPLVLIFCTYGAWALGNRLFDVWVMIAFGFVGLIMERFRIPTAPFVLGFVLAPLAEENLVKGLMLTGGDALPILTSPISATLLLLSVVALVAPHLPWRKWMPKVSGHADP